jgi:peptidoglycan/LPS O-acetylase OafA/YrhL
MRTAMSTIRFSAAFSLLSKRITHKRWEKGSSMSSNTLPHEDLVQNESLLPAPGPSRTTKQSKSSVALDQWRGFAVLLVLMSHGLLFTDMVNGVGRIGVNIFFFISGILVFRSLSSHPGSSSAVMKGFWVRRLRRLYPALAAYVGAMLVLTLPLQHLHNLPPFSDFTTYLYSLPWALSYTLNYYPSHSRSLGHLWSLACEVQFYALAPLLFFLGGRFRARRTAFFAAVTVAICTYGFIQPLRAHGLEQSRYHFEVAIWPMMLGFFCESVKRWFLKIPRSIAYLILILGAVALTFSLVAMIFGMRMKFLVVASGSFLLWPCLISYLFGFTLPGPAGRFVSWTGARSYSIYLWQQPLTICGYLPRMLQPLGSLAALAIGGISFNLLERPFLTKARQNTLARTTSAAPPTNSAAIRATV